jgi:hypothetical protein
MIVVFERNEWRTDESRIAAREQIKKSGSTANFMPR